MGCHCGVGQVMGLLVKVGARIGWLKQPLLVLLEREKRRPEELEEEKGEGENRKRRGSEDREGLHIGATLHFPDCLQ